MPDRDPVFRSLYKGISLIISAYSFQQINC